MLPPIHPSTPFSHTAVEQIGYRDGDGVVARLIRGQPSFLISLDITPQPDGKGTLYAQEMWIWLVDRGAQFHRNEIYDFYAWVDEDLAFEFRMRWL